MRQQPQETARLEPVIIRPDLQPLRLGSHLRNTAIQRIGRPEALNPEALRAGRALQAFQRRTEFAIAGEVGANRGNRAGGIRGRRRRLLCVLVATPSAGAPRFFAKHQVGNGPDQTIHPIRAGMPR